MKDQIPPEIKHARLEQVERLAAQIRAELLQEMIARAEGVSVLFETYHDGVLSGHTPNFVEVHVPGPSSLCGCSHTVLPCAIEKNGVGVTGRLLCCPDKPNSNERSLQTDDASTSSSSSAR
jgi:tRNA A37 methylthiotransferase MiaB